MSLVAFSAWALLSGVSHAADLNTAPPKLDLKQAPAPAAAAASSSPRTDRDMWMEANIRYRSMFVPNSLLDIWYFDEDDDGAYPEARPKLRAYAIGVEYVLKPRPVNWIFYYEYIGSKIESGYWDDVEEPPEHDDGDWIEEEGFGIHAIGFNYGHEIDVTPPDRDVWMSLMFGAGLGVGFLTGELSSWHPGSNPNNAEPDCLPQSPAYDRKDYCEADGEVRLPGAFPILDLTASAKVNFADYAHVRLDMGLHDLVYIGGAVGGAF